MREINNMNRRSLDDLYSQCSEILDELHRINDKNKTFSKNASEYDLKSHAPVSDEHELKLIISEVGKSVAANIRSAEFKKKTFEELNEQFLHEEFNGGGISGNSENTFFDAHNINYTPDFNNTYDSAPKKDMPQKGFPAFPDLSIFNPPEFSPQNEHEKKSKSKLPKAFLSLANVLLCVYIAAAMVCVSVLFSAGISRERPILGVRLCKLESTFGSIKKGSLVFIKNMPFEKLSAGDTVIFKTDEDGNQSAEYRAAGIVDGPFGPQTFTENGISPAGYVVPTEMVLGKMVFSIPVLGGIIDFLNKFIIIVLIALVVLGAALVILRRFIKKKAGISENISTANVREPINEDNNFDRSSIDEREYISAELFKGIELKKEKPDAYYRNEYINFLSRMETVLTKLRKNQVEILKEIDMLNDNLKRAYEDI